MRTTPILTFFAFVAACCATHIPGRYIVELDDLQVLSGAKRSFASAHEVLYHTMRKRGVGFEVATEYDTSGVFVGASLTLSPEDVNKVASMPGVKAIRPVISVPGPKPIDSRVVKPGEANVPDSESTHIMTGVDKVHAQGITGKGIKIGIIDTGIDYTHPALGGGIGPGHKVIGGYDFVGDAYNGTNTPSPDNDPLDQCNGHGTHVAGIIGANPGNDFNISGVAYDASIASYRLFGCSGSVSDDIITEALLRGYSDGMDILTLSLGGVNGWSESSSGVVASRIADKGTVVTIAAGNDGDMGSWYASSPGTGLDVISVASVDNTVIPMQNATVLGVDHAPINYLSALPLKVNGTLSVYATSKDPSEPADACDPLPDSTPDLSDKLVVVRRGTCAFTDKLQNIAAKGGKVTFIYNNVEAFAGISVGNYTAVLISPEDGAFLVNSFASGTNISISFPQSGGAYNYPDPLGGLVSSFSTYGPSYDMNFKPAVAAPGGNILSTLPLPLGGWGVESGTSMATPFTAGSAALILQAKGRAAAKGLRDLLQATASPVSSSHSDSDPLQTLSQQGAGLIQVNSAINSKTVVSPGQFTLNDTAHFDATHSFTIKNTGSTPQTYKLSHVPAGTAVTVTPGTIYPAAGPLNLTSEYASVRLSQSQVTVRPGGSTTVVATFVAPTVHDPSTYPVYSGFIEISSGPEIQHVSYLGVAGNLKNKQVLDNTDQVFGFQIPAIVDPAGNPKVNASYSLAGDDQPTVLYRLAFGSPLVRLDLVSKDFSLPSHAKRSFFSWWWGSNFFGFDSIKTLGALDEQDYTPRNGDATTLEDNGWNQYTFNGTFADGSSVKDGEYKFLLRALRVTGNPSDQSDYDNWVSPAFAVKQS